MITSPSPSSKQVSTSSGSSARTFFRAGAMKTLWRRKGVSHPVLVEPSRGRAGGEVSISQEVGGARASQLQLLSRKPKSDPRAQKELMDNSLLLPDASVSIASNISEVATTFPLQSDLTGGSFNRVLVVRSSSSSSSSSSSLHHMRSLNATEVAVPVSLNITNAAASVSVTGYLIPQVDIGSSGVIAFPTQFP